MKDDTVETENLHKTGNQLRKALKLSAVLMGTAGVVLDAEDLENETVRRLAETLAGVSESSDTTWAMVAVLLEGKA